MGEEDLRKIGDVAIKYDLVIISDEIYEKLIYGKKHISIASLSKELKDRTITINGVSKAYAMTGWRMGYLAAPKHIAKGILDLQGHMTSNPNSIAQYATIAALEMDEKVVKKRTIFSIYNNYFINLFFYFTLFFYIHIKKYNLIYYHF